MNKTEKELRDYFENNTYFTDVTTSVEPGFSEWFNKYSDLLEVFHNDYGQSYFSLFRDIVVTKINDDFGFCENFYINDDNWNETLSMCKECPIKVRELSE